MSMPIFLRISLAIVYTVSPAQAMGFIGICVHPLPDPNKFDQTPFPPLPLPPPPPLPVPPLLDTTKNPRSSPIAPRLLYFPQLLDFFVASAALSSAAAAAFFFLPKNDHPDVAVFLTGAGLDASNFIRIGSNP
jgi:hypothetical protein